MLVIDGTILLALAVETPQSGFARAQVEEGAALAAPQAALAEALEGARRLMKEGHVAQADFERLPGLWAPLLAVLAADAPLLGRAAHLAAAYDLATPAALALALAENKGAPLATLDARLANAALDVLGAGRALFPGEAASAG
jgi:predicted nucleic acid-binding protein